MAESAPVAWQHLFVAGDASHPEALVKFQIVRRPGGVMLALPSDGTAAACALKFFDESLPAPPATKGALALAFKLKLPTALEKFSLPIEREEPFAAFLTKVARARRFPEFAIESIGDGGSADSYSMAVFNEKHEPAAIVKAAIIPEAKDLIGDEAYFLESVRAGTPGVPRLIGSLRDGRVEALAMEFVAGVPPGVEDEAGVERLLSSWVDTTREMPLCEMFPWQMLEAACDSQSPKAKWSEIRARKCHPVVFNGDFAPWTIRATAGGWVGLNWERGEMAGVPGWDWFHYIVQAALLGRSESAPSTAARVERMLGSEGFRRYSQKAAITGLERALLLAYLDYALNVLPSHDQGRLQELKTRLSETFPKAA
jgi:hypothetical protein